MSKPIKRSEHLLKISREHYTGLLFCWKLRQGISKNADKEVMQRYVAYFFREHLIMHFDEEEILFDLKKEDPMVQRALREHHIICDGCEKIIATLPAEYETYREIADTVDQHIRYEERELFPYLEKEIPEAQLKKAHIAIVQMNPDEAKDSFAEEFWKRS